MHYSYIARQPIFDRNLQVYGYELLFRDSEANVFPDTHPDEATSKLLLEQHLLGDIDTVCLGKQAFINFHTNTIIHKFPDFLDAEKVWIEVLETVEVSHELKRACELTNHKGYRLALDDHDFSERWKQLMPHINLVKIDIQDQGLQLAKRLQWFKQRGVPILAERVETQEQYEACRELGFDFFQGFFFERPEIIKRESLSPQKSNMLTIMSEMFKPELNFQKLAAVIQNDLSLTYSLLKLINSPAFGLRTQVRDINHALTYLGEAEVKKYLALVVLANLSHDEPEELNIKSLTRARFMELIVGHGRAGRETSSAFMVGMLSLLDVILRQPLDQILLQLPLVAELNEALVARDGKLGRILALVEAYEQADWSKVDDLMQVEGLQHLDIGQYYLDASQWTGLLLEHA